jgi:ubiquinone/menaquinone biosynthesis C-methylase UbiE
MRDYTRLGAFLDKRFAEIYPEPLGEPHISIIRRMVPELIDHYDIQPGAKVLDVGCGHGLALKAFRDHECQPIGIGFGDEAEKCRVEGFEVVEADMSFLDFPDESFDVVWCRHVIEHSIFPYFTLHEIFRLLKAGGVFYMEVPAPGTSCNHESNPNHYSVLTKEMWLSLLRRIGFSHIRQNDISFKVPAGADVYYAFDSRKA